MKFMSLALAFLAAANASKCMIKVCNRSPTWLNIGAVASKKLDKYQRIGGVGKGKCQSMPCPDKSFLKVERGSKQVALMSDVSCGGTYNVCGYMVVNKSSQTVMAFVKKGMPMIIPAGQRATVAGVEGLPIHVVDPKTKAVHKVFKPKKCGRWLKLQESDCRPAPQPDPATPSPVRSPTGKPTSKPTSAPTGMPMQAANQSLTTSPTVEADVRSSDKCVPVDKCGTLKGCYFFDFVDGAEHSLDTPISAGHQFSIRCDTDGSIDKVVFFDSNGAILNEETTAPFWIHGHLPDGTLSRARPLAMCETREFTVHGSMTKQPDDEACFEERMSVNAECLTQSPTSARTSPPTEGPTSMPTVNPTSLPTKSPTESPTKAPTSGPSRSSTESPTKSPSSAPTSSPTNTPTRVPTTEPTRAPTEGPTAAPTTSPTKNPTEAPTGEPTLFPTKEPTVGPTASPTIRPTNSPTVSPTDAPTKDPTAAPTKAPTDGPTKQPTGSPSTNPTSAPTYEPSAAPSGNPTLNPTFVPTETPTKYPTEEPTKEPTAAPTKAPTNAPTKQPTGSPSTNPTPAPTFEPSAAPSGDPTLNPTFVPTETPTASPTKTPTSSPTKYPTEEPTKEPTAAPTKAPTDAPTKQPTGSPSTNPTSDPTFKPSEVPSGNPTLNPTFVPTETPTKYPTEEPTKDHTAAPTKAPTGAPTKQPTGSPSENPTSAPTYKPSEAPSGNPTLNPTFEPTETPTALPTKTPTSSPTKYPTKGPTSQPTEEPSASPTKSPTSPPTEVPSLSPTEKPTSSPTLQPTLSPVLIEATRVGEKPSPSPTGAPAPRDTPSPTCIGHPTALRGGIRPTPAPTPKCDVPNHPRMCYLWRSTLRYWDSVPWGTKVEVLSYTGKHFIYNSHGKKSNSIYGVPFHKFKSLPFAVRFTNKCGSSSWVLCKNYTPIGLDIDHSGAVEHIVGSFKIDITGDGEINDLEEWFAPTEGILIDTSHGVLDGIINGKHLFGDQGGTYADGFEKLLEHDDDGDGVVSGSELDGFMIWTDMNSNAKVDDGELSTLEHHGIVALNTMHKDMVSHADLADGSKMRMEDLWFSR